jgi:hypothetical protein
VRTFSHISQGISGTVAPTKASSALHCRSELTPFVPRSSLHVPVVMSAGKSSCNLMCSAFADILTSSPSMRSRPSTYCWSSGFPRHTVTVSPVEKRCSGMPPGSPYWGEKATMFSATQLAERRSSMWPSALRRFSPQCATRSWAVAVSAACSHFTCDQGTVKGLGYQPGPTRRLTSSLHVSAQRDVRTWSCSVCNLFVTFCLVCGATASDRPRRSGRAPYTIRRNAFAERASILGSCTFFKC